MDYYISSGIVSSGLILNNDNMYVFYGGTVNNTTLGHLSELHVFSGGVASSTVVNENGNLYVESYGMANDTIINQGTLCIGFRGIANDTNIYQGGILHILNGGVANNTSMMNDDWNDPFDMYNGFARNDLTACVMYISSGGIANSLNVSTGASVYVADGGIANDTIVDNGYLYVCGGMVSKTIVQCSEYIIYGDCYGYMYVSNGGIANDTTVNNNGRMYVSGGGVANNTLVEAGHLYVCEGAANHTIIKGGFVEPDEIILYGNCNGYMYVSNGGTATDTTVNSGGRMYVSNGGTATDTTVNSGGRMYVSSGGILSGEINVRGQIEVNGTAEASHADLNFDLTETDSENTYFVSSLSKLRGLSSYSVTILDVQTIGIYCLAQDAATFDGTLSVRNITGEKLGVLSLNQECVIGEYVYLLNLSSQNNLTLNVEKSLITITGNPGSWTMHDVILTANFSDEIVSRQYSFDNNTWLDYTEPLVIAENKTVYFKAKDSNGEITIKSVVVDKIDKNPQQLYVNEAWKSLAVGTDVDVSDGKKAVIGQDAFADIDSAKVVGEASGRNYSIDILGEYSGDMTAIGNTYQTNGITTSGNICAGVASEVPEEVNASIRNTTASRLYVGKQANDVVQTGTKAVVTAEISGSRLTNGVFGGGEVSNSTIFSDTRMSFTDSTTNIVTGGAYLSKGMVDDVNVSIANGNNVLELKDSSVSNFVIGSGVVNAYGMETRNGNIDITVNDGSITTLLGGSYLQSAKVTETGESIMVSSEITGDISIKIGGGVTVAYVYGAGGGKFASSTRPDEKAQGSGIVVKGDVNIDIDLTHGAAVSNGVVAGSFGWGIVDGNTSITVKGNGEKDSLGSAYSILTGDSSMRGDGGQSGTFVTGTKTLNISNFNGSLKGYIGYFDTINIENSSVDVDWRNINPLTKVSTTMEVMNWKFSSTDKEQTAFNCTSDEWGVSLSGVNLEFNCTDLTSDGDEWTCFNASFESIQDFDSIGAGSLLVNGSTFNLGDYDEDDMSYTSEDGLYKVGLSSNEGEGDRLFVTCIA